MKTLKELTDIGTVAALQTKSIENKTWLKISPDRLASATTHFRDDEPARQAFAEAVKMGVEKPLLERIKELEARAEKAEELAATEKRKRLYAEEQLGILAKTFGYEGRTWCNMVSYLCPRLQKAEARIKELESNLPQLRPLPTPPVTIPLDASDIRATDEFKEIGSDVVETANYWGCESVDLTYSAKPSYEELAANYLRRQHGSTEWKPCTKEARP